MQELDELYTKLQIVTGFTAEQLLEMFAAGYTLEKPDYSKHFEAMANLAESDPPNEWVSVEERLPEKRGEYIVCACDEGEPIDERIWGDTVVICADYYDGTFTWYEGNTEYDISDIVTHWMLLPAPPTKEE